MDACEAGGTKMAERTRGKGGREQSWSARGDEWEVVGVDRWAGGVVEEGKEALDIQRSSRPRPAPDRDGRGPRDSIALVRWNGHWEKPGARVLLGTVMPAVSLAPESITGEHHWRASLESVTGEHPPRDTVVGEVSEAILLLLGRCASLGRHSTATHLPYQTLHRR